MVRSDPNAASVMLGIGFCLNRTPATFRHESGGYSGKGSENDYGMKVCLDRPRSYGDVHNDASHAATASSNSPAEIARRLENLKKAFMREAVRTRPVLVTICRSVRDGYTIPAVWHQIESGLMQILEQVWGPLDVTYDKNLLGGKGGWLAHNPPFY